MRKADTIIKIVGFALTIAGSIVGAIATKRDNATIIAEEVKKHFENENGL